MFTLVSSKSGSRMELVLVDSAEIFSSNGCAVDFA